MTRAFHHSYRKSALHIVMRSLTVLAIFIPLSATARQWTLEQCIEYAVANNLSIKKRAIDMQQSDIQLNTSKNSWLPEVRADLGEQLSFGNYNATTGSMDARKTSENRDLSYTTGALSASINLFNGFKVMNSIKADQFNLDAATADLEQARKDISIQVATQYLQCLYYKGLSDVARQQVELSRNLLERTVRMVEEGRRPLSEQKEFESTLAGDRYTLSEAEGNYKLAILALAQFLNIPADQDFEICEVSDYSVITQPADSIYENAQNFWPALMAAKAKVEESMYRVKIAKSDFYPVLSLGGSLKTFNVSMFRQDLGFGNFGEQFFRNNPNQVIGLQLSVPIFNRMQTRNNVRKAEAALQRRNVELEECNLNLLKEIQTACANAEVAREKEIAAQKSAEAAHVSFIYEQECYESGRGSVYDIQQARQKYFKASQKAVQSKYEYLIRQRILKFYQQF